MIAHDAAPDKLRPVIGRLPSGKARRADLMSIAYVFSGFDRILGFYGRLDLAASRELVLQDLLVCCTRCRSGPDREKMSSEIEFMERCLRSSGWAPAAHARNVWHLPPYQIVLYSDDEAASGAAFHVALHLGDGLQYLDNHLSRAVVRHRGLIERMPAQQSRRFEGPAVSPVAEAMELLRGAKRIAVYTGAGISAASGIPTFFGTASLDARISLQEPFPGDVVAWMCGNPAALAYEIGVFQARLLSARPNDAHRMLAQLETSGKVAFIVTTNLDRLHQDGGSRTVLTPRQFLDLSAEGLAIDALLTIGVSDDTEGVVARARECRLPVVAASIDRPSFVTEGDCYLSGSADALLRELVGGSKRDADERAEQSSVGSFPALAFPHARSTRMGALRHSIPDFERLTAEVLKLAPLGGSSVHGERHWQETAWLGLDLLSTAEDADPTVVLLFALLHDSCRICDDHDPDHGRRAAEQVHLLAQSHLRLDADQVAVLTAACKFHADGHVTAHPTIGLCWDADRLGLWRIGVEPQLAALSHPAARNVERIAAARAVAARPLSWTTLFCAYTQLPRMSR